MRFLFGVIILFAASFGGVYWYQSLHQPEEPVDVAALLASEPEEYRRIHLAFGKIGSDEIQELDRALIAYHSHRNKNALRQDVSGLAYRAIESRQDMLNSAGLPWLERITHETVDLIHRYGKYGEAFCSLSIQRDHLNAERVLAENRREQETIELVEEFSQARFELVVLMLEALVDGKSNPVSLPEVDRSDLNEILKASASAEDAEIIRKLKTPNWTCREALAVLQTALSIENEGERYVTLAEMRTGI